MTKPALARILPHASVIGDAAALARSDRVAIIASFGSTPEVTRSLATLVARLEENGYAVLLVRASDSADPPVWPEGHGEQPVTIVKPNLGYDFGSWATGLAIVPELAGKPFVILANDSLVGPFASLAPMLADFETAPADVWGATNTDEYRPHLQSYLIGFRSGVLAHPAVEEFWRSIRAMNDKDRIVIRYEMGLSRLLRAEGFVTRPWFEGRWVVPQGGNPTLIGWERLLEAGFPFVKRILIDNAEIFPRATEAASVVRERYGAELSEWL
jgi:hypothetical protein